jgi:hypothetical protein
LACNAFALFWPQPGQRNDKSCNQADGDGNLIHYGDPQSLPL